jgi:hypothetical protein
MQINSQTLKESKMQKPRRLTRSGTSPAALGQYAVILFCVLCLGSLAYLSMRVKNVPKTGEGSLQPLDHGRRCMQLQERQGGGGCTARGTTRQNTWRESAHAWRCMHGTHGLPCALGRLPASRRACTHATCVSSPGHATLDVCRTALHNPNSEIFTVSGARAAPRGHSQHCFAAAAAASAVAAAAAATARQRHSSTCPPSLPRPRQHHNARAHKRVFLRVLGRSGPCKRPAI